jgi:hypothetical protein
MFTHLVEIHHFRTSNKPRPVSRIFSIFYSTVRMRIKALPLPGKRPHSASEPVNTGSEMNLHTAGSKRNYGVKLQR